MGVHDHAAEPAAGLSSAEGVSQSASGVTLRRQARIARFALLPVLLIVAWQIATYLEAYPQALFPQPLRVLDAAHRLILSGELFVHLGDSLRRIAIANLVSIAVAVPLGLLMGRYRVFEEIADGVLNLIRPIPPLAWIPLAILWFGLGEKAVVFITLISAFFAILLNTIAGVHRVDKSLVRAALSLGANQAAVLRYVVLPSTLPHIFTGIRIALGVSWMSIVAAELVAASSGLGFMISYYRELLRSDLILVGMLTIGIVGFLMDRALLLLERQLLPWLVRSDAR